jgi:hypothetical protein
MAEGTLNLESKKRVLLATSSVTQSFTLRAISDRFDVVPVTTSAQAHKQLKQPFDVIICGSLFDESRMFDLLRYCKSMPHTKNIPFICVRARGGELDETAFQGVAIALKALGAEGFIDLYRWTKDIGAEQAFEMLRKVIVGLATNRRSDLLNKII